MTRRFTGVMRIQLMRLLEVLEASVSGLHAEGIWLGPDFQIYLTQATEQHKPVTTPAPSNQPTRRRALVRA